MTTWAQHSCSHSEFMVVQRGATQITAGAIRNTLKLDLGVGCYSCAVAHNQHTSPMVVFDVFLHTTNLIFRPSWRPSHQLATVWQLIMQHLSRRKTHREAQRSRQLAPSDNAASYQNAASTIGDAAREKSSSMALAVPPGVTDISPASGDGPSP